jgi:hypothetical protein
MDLEETEARNDCAGEDQQNLNQPADPPSLQGVSQRGQEPLDTEAEEATPLEAVIKQRSENRD